MHDPDLKPLRTYDDRAEAEAYAREVRGDCAADGYVTVEECLLGKCRGCRGLGWLGSEALFRCPGCVKDGRVPTPLTRSEAAYERALEAAETAMKATGQFDHDAPGTNIARIPTRGGWVEQIWGTEILTPYDMLAWYLDPRRTLWERL